MLIHSIQCSIIRTSVTSLIIYTCMCHIINSSQVRLEVLQVVTMRISVTRNVMTLPLSQRQMELEVPLKCWQISTRMWYHIPDDSNIQSPISLTYVDTFNQ